jgi:hypothetical protein
LRVRVSGKSACRYQKDKSGNDWCGISDYEGTLDFDLERCDLHGSLRSVDSSWTKTEPKTVHERPTFYLLSRIRRNTCLVVCRWEHGLSF